MAKVARWLTAQPLTALAAAILLVVGILLIALARNPGRFGVDAGSAYVWSWALAGVAALIASPTPLLPRRALRAAGGGASFNFLLWSFTFDSGYTWLVLSRNSVVLWLVPALIIGLLAAELAEDRLAPAGLSLVWLVVGAFICYVLVGAYVIIGVVTCHCLTL